MQHLTATPAHLTVEPSPRSSEDGSSVLSGSRFCSTDSDTMSLMLGPGALSGKFLLAFGKLTLKGVESMVIMRRMSAIRAACRDRGSVMLLDEEDNIFCDDLLELSRPGMYKDSLRSEALSLLLEQIASGRTRSLTRAVVKWPQVEIQLFIREIMACLPPKWVGQDPNIARTFHMKLRHVYMSTFYNYFKHSAAAFVQFIAELSAASHDAAQAAVAAGFLDTLLHLCVSNFSDIRDSFDDNSLVRERREVIVKHCHKVLETLAFYPSVQCTIKEHPLHVVWPREYFSKLESLGVTSCDESDLARLRKDIWWRLGNNVISSRLASIDDDILERIGLLGSTSILRDACSDLVEFTRTGTYHPDVTNRALVCLLKCIALGGDTWQILKSVFASCTTNDLHRVFKRLIECFMFNAYVGPISKLPKLKPHIFLSFESVLARNKSVQPLDYFIEFAVSCAHHAPSIGRAFLRAGIVPLLFALLADVLSDPFEDPLLMPENEASAWAMLDVHTLKFTKSVELEGGILDPWTDGAAQNRHLAAILALLLVLLKDGRSDGVDAHEKIVDRAFETIGYALHDAEVLSSLRPPREGSNIRDEQAGLEQNRMLLCYQALAVLLGCATDIEVSIGGGRGSLANTIDSDMTYAEDDDVRRNSYVKKLSVCSEFPISIIGPIVAEPESFLIDRAN